MNGQFDSNNQFNNQFNNQPINDGLSMPQGHIRKKFFSNAFLSNNEENNVGNATSMNNNTSANWNNQPNSGFVQPPTDGYGPAQLPPQNVYREVINYNQSPPMQQPMPQQQMPPQQVAPQIMGETGYGHPPNETTMQIPIQQSMPQQPMMAPPQQEMTSLPSVPQQSQYIPPEPPRTEPENFNVETPTPNNVSIESLEEAKAPEVAETEVLEDMQQDSSIEALDLDDGLVENTGAAKNSSIQVPVIDQGINNAATPAQPEPEIQMPKLNTVEVFKPQNVTTPDNFDFGYKTQVVSTEELVVPEVPTPTVPGAVVPPVGVVPTVQPGATLENSAIFQQATQQATQSATPQPVQQQPVNNGPVEQWVASQPLSADSLEQEVLDEEPVMSANKREELLKKQQEAMNKKQMPVPAEVVKPTEEVKIRKELLVKEYIGEDYSKIVMSPFSIGAFIFGAAFFAFRKMYFFALLNLAASIAILFLVPINYNYLALLGLHILMALAVNRIYVLKVKMIASYMAKRNEKRKEPVSQDRLEDVMRNKGKNAVILGMLVVCLFVASIVFISVYIKPEGNKFAELIYNTFGGSPKDIKEAHFTGEIIYDDYDVTKLISYEVPEGFVKADPNKEYYKISTNGTGTFNECSFKFGVVKDFKSGNSYVIKMAEYYEEGDKVSNPKGVEWTTYSTQDGTSTIYYRGATAKEKAILFEYRIGNDADQETCIAHYLKLMESITILKEE